MPTQNNKKRINHNEVCQECGKPATRNIQNMWHEYKINKEGEFIEVDSWEGNGNEMLCDDCEGEEKI